MSHVSIQNQEQTAFTFQVGPVDRGSGMELPEHHPTTVAASSLTTSEKAATPLIATPPHSASCHLTPSLGGVGGLGPSTAQSDGGGQVPMTQMGTAPPPSRMSLAPPPPDPSMLLHPNTNYIRYICSCHSPTINNLSHFVRR